MLAILNLRQDLISVGTKKGHMIEAIIITSWVENFTTIFYDFNNPPYCSILTFVFWIFNWIELNSIQADSTKLNKYLHPNAEAVEISTFIVPDNFNIIDIIYHICESPPKNTFLGLHSQIQREWIKGIKFSLWWVHIIMRLGCCKYSKGNCCHFPCFLQVFSLNLMIDTPKYPQVKFMT